jgi:hypothetical protein
MLPRLMVVCLGGLAGAGALVCCDLDEGVEALEAQPDGQAIEDGAATDQRDEAAAGPSPLH